LYKSTGPQAVPDQPITAPYFAHGKYHWTTANGPCMRTVNIIIV